MLTLSRYYDTVNTGYLPIGICMQNWIVHALTDTTLSISYSSHIRVYSVEKNAQSF